MKNMSTNYYLVETAKKEELNRFSDFWENTFYPQVKNLVDKYFKENQGKFINNDTLEDVMNADSMCLLKYCPLNDDHFSCHIGTSTATNFYWDYLSLDWGKSVIYDFDSLKNFLEENPSYAIYDEYNTIIDIDKFEKMVKSRGRKSNC